MSKPAPLAIPLRVMTYNIHKGIGGVDRRYRLERIIETIARYEPDLVMLQEVDDGVPRSRQDSQVNVIGEALGFAYRAYQRNVRLRTGHYGNAILSRAPLTDVESVDLTIPLKKRRQALVAHCRLRDGQHTRTVLVFNVHLGLAGLERTAQARRILASPPMSRTRRTTATIVAGDFNDVWGGLGRRILEPAGFQPAHGPLRTFPAALPWRPLDRVYYRGGLRLDHCFASRSELSRQASDHLPVIAHFEVT